MNVYLDIETIPEQPEETAKAEIADTIKAPAKMSKAETIADWHSSSGKYEGAKDKLVDETYRKTSFNGAKGQIASIAWAVNDGDIISVRQDEGASETDALTAFFDYMSQFKRPQEPYFIGHYIGGFDLKFLFHRAVINGIRPSCKLPFTCRHGSDYFCTMQAWAGFRDTISQENLCKALGIEGKQGMDGSMVWDYFKEGRYDEIEEYNRNDVEIVREIHKRLTFTY